jgi:hypothetical protein
LTLPLGSADNVRFRLFPHPSGVYGDTVDGRANLDLDLDMEATVSWVRSSARSGFCHVVYTAYIETESAVAVATGMVRARIVRAEDEANDILIDTTSSYVLCLLSVYLLWCSEYCMQLNLNLSYISVISILTGY